LKVALARSASSPPLIQGLQCVTWWRGPISSCESIASWRIIPFRNLAMRVRW
jgi:hypothetical protein